MADSSSYPPLDKRPIANTICLFDVDGTLTMPRLVRTPSNQALNGTLNFS